MDYQIESLEISNFKSFSEKQEIKLSDLSVFLGANSSGKSTALQTMLLIKQTMECNSPDIDLLLSGKYVVLGDFDDVISDSTKEEFSFCLNFINYGKNENASDESKYSIKWIFCKAETTSQAKLNTIEVTFDRENVKFSAVEPHLFQLSVNGVDSPILFNITNLCFPKFYIVKYDKAFNSEFADLLNSIMRIVEGNKTTLINKNKLVSEQLDEFYMRLFELEDDIYSNEKTNALARRLLDLVDSYCLKQNPMGLNPLWTFRESFRERCIAAAINRAGKIDLFEDILNKYKKYYDTYSMPSLFMEFDGVERIPLLLYDLAIDSRKSKINEVCTWVNGFYEIIEDFFSKIFFLGPIRELPRGLYSIGFENIPKYVGPTGSNFASVLLHENKQREYILPNDEVATTSLMEALGAWAVHLNIATSVHVEQSNSFGINVSISNTQFVDADIMNVGIGTSQVLPVLIMGLLSEKEEILLFEQPELHLHPYSQSRLADFFVGLIKHGRKIIVETHSDTFLLRLRYNLLINQCEKEAIAVNFFKNENGTKVALCNINGFGSIEYPDDFKDETQELLDNLVNATLNNRVKR